MSEPRLPGTPDFLDRMIDKAFDADNALQPRLPSLYEPLTGLAAGAGAMLEPDTIAPSDEQVMQPAQRPIRHMQPGPLFQSLHEAASVQDNDSVNVDRAPRRGDANHSSITARDEPRPLSPTAEAAASLVTTHAAIPRVAEAHTSDDAISAPRSPVLNRQPPGRVNDVLLRNEQRSATLAPVTGQTISSIFVLDTEYGDKVRAPQERRAEARNVNREAMEQGVLVPSVTQIVQQIVADRPLERHRPFPDREQSEALGLDSGPTVNVTIGRLEVRAVQAPSAAKKVTAQAHGPKPLSLDEYVKQRGGGR